MKIVPDAILLNAEGVHVEEKAVLAVAEGIQDETELIVVVDLLAPDHVRTNLVRFGIKTNANDVEILIGVAEIDFGFLRDGRTIFRVALDEAINLQHLAGEGWRGLHRKEVSNGRALFQVRDMETREGYRILGRRTCQGWKRRAQKGEENQP